MRKSGLHDLIERDGQVADAFAGGVVNGVGDGCCSSGDSDLTNAAGTEGIEFVVGDVERGDVDLMDVGVDGNVVFGEVLVNGAAIGVVDERFFVQRHADAPDDSANQLIGSSGVVDEGADVVGADHATDLHHV